MASLTTCIKKAGAYLPAEDRAAILAAAQEARTGGMRAGEAGRAAVLAQLEAVRRALGDAEQRLQDAEAGRKPAVEPNDTTAPPNLAAELDMILQRNSEDQPATAPRDRMEAVALQFPDLMVQMDGMEKPMPVAEFMAAIKAEADDLAADAPLMQIAAECALLNAAG